MKEIIDIIKEVPFFVGYFLLRRVSWVSSWLIICFFSIPRNSFFNAKYWLGMSLAYMEYEYPSMYKNEPSHIRLSSTLYDNTNAFGPAVSS